MPVPQFSRRRLNQLLDKRFDGNATKLTEIMILIDPLSKWSPERVRRLLRGDTRPEPNDLMVLRLALALDKIDDLYETTEVEN